MLRRQPVHQVYFCAYCPLASRRRFHNSLDDVFGRTHFVRQLEDFPGALRMSTWVATPATAWASRWSKWPYGIHMRMRAGFPRRICGRRTLSCGRDTAPFTCDSCPNTSSERAKPIPASGLLLTRSAPGKSASWRTKWFDRIHHQGSCGIAAREPMGRRHRNTLGEPPGGGASGPPDYPSRRLRVYVQHYVSNFSPAPLLDA